MATSKEQKAQSVPSAPVYLVCGDDDFLVKEAAKSIVSALVPDEMRDMGLETIAGDCQVAEDACAALRRCLESLETPGFFGGIKLTWLKDVGFFAMPGKRRPGDSEDTRALVDELVARIKDGRISKDLPLLVSTSSINRASALFKAAKAKGEVRDFGSAAKPSDLDKQAGPRLDERLKDLPFRMDNNAKAAFIARVGADTRRITSELEKLLCYVGEGKTATADDVSAIVSAGRESVAWDFQDAFGKRDAAKFIAVFRSLVQQGEKPIGLAAMLDSRIRDLLFAREALDRGWIIRSSGGGFQWGAFPPAIEKWFEENPKNDVRSINPWRYRHIVEQADKWRLNELRLARHRMIELHEQMVSIQISPEFLLESTGLRCIGKR